VQNYKTDSSVPFSPNRRHLSFVKKTTTTTTTTTTKTTTTTTT
jgi:hypothetical protein